jgi:hypothetical protein
VSPVKYGFGFYIPKDDILRSDCRDDLKSYILSQSPLNSYVPTQLRISEQLPCDWWPSVRVKGKETEEVPCSASRSSPGPARPVWFRSHASHRPVPRAILTRLSARVG